MNRRSLFPLVALTFGACGLFRGAEEPAPAQSGVPLESTRLALENLEESGSLNRLCAGAVGLAVQERANTIAFEDLSAAVIDLAKPSEPQFGHCQGLEPHDPAQLIAVPLAIEALRQRVEGRVTEHQISEPLRRAFTNGDTAAINGLLDLLTGTESGPAIIGPALTEFLQRRMITTRTLESMGLYGIVAGHHAGAIQRESRDDQAAQRLPTPINQMSALAVAKLLYLIDTGQVVSVSGTARTAALMSRDASSESEISSRIPAPLPSGSYLYGMAAWGQRANHGAWVVTLRNDRRVIVCVFCRVGEIQPRIARTTATRLITAMAQR